jgi:sec-independent protein translocase protein TatA
MRGILEPDHLIFILLIVLVLFGGKKIPELAGGLGKGIREFKRGMEVGDTGPASAAAELREPTHSAARSDDTVERAPKRLIG